MLKRNKKIPKQNITEIILKLRKNVTNTISGRYQCNKTEYNIKQVNDIVFNEKVQLVAYFKDYLILDDNSEFLKR